MKKIIIVLLISLLPISLFAYMGDNLGNHKATKDINMDSHDIDSANTLTAKNINVTSSMTVKAGSGIPSTGYIVNVTSQNGTSLLNVTNDGAATVAGALTSGGALTSSSGVSRVASLSTGLIRTTGDLAAITIESTLVTVNRPTLGATNITATKNVSAESINISYLNVGSTMNITAGNYFTDVKVSSAIYADTSGAVPATGITAGTIIDTVLVSTKSLIATGMASNTTYLRGDGSWNTPAGGGEGAYPDLILTASEFVNSGTADTGTVTYAGATQTYEGVSSEMCVPFYMSFPDVVKPNMLSARKSVPRSWLATDTNAYAVITTSGLSSGVAWLTLSISTNPMTGVYTPYHSTTVVSGVAYEQAVATFTISGLTAGQAFTTILSREKGSSCKQIIYCDIVNYSKN